MKINRFNIQKIKKKVYVVLVLYIIILLLVGRFLAYNDILPKYKIQPNLLIGYNYSKIEFISFDSTHIRGWFIKSSNNNGKTLFLLYGWLSDRNSIINQAKMFVDSGYNVIIYDQRSHGESETGLVTYGDAEGKDLISAINYSKSLKYINQEKLGVIGFSLGTGAAIYAQKISKNKAFRVMILEGVFASSYDVGEKILVDKFGYIGGKFVEYGIFTPGTKLWSLGRFKHFNAANYVSKIENTPILIIRGENDSLVSYKSYQKFMDSIHTYHKTWCTEKGCHTYSYYKYPNEYKNITLQFLRKYLN